MLWDAGVQTNCPKIRVCSMSPSFLKELTLNTPPWNEHQGPVDGGVLVGPIPRSSQRVHRR